MDHSRCDLDKVRKRLISLLGRDRERQYWASFRKFLSARISHREWERNARTLMGNENRAIKVHNEFIMGLLHNARLPKALFAEAKKQKAKERAKKKGRELQGLAKYPSELVRINRFISKVIYQRTDGDLETTAAEHRFATLSEAAERLSAMLMSVSTSGSGSDPLVKTEEASGESQSSVPTVGAIPAGMFQGDSLLSSPTATDRMDLDVQSQSSPFMADFSPTILPPIMTESSFGSGDALDMTRDEASSTGAAPFAAGATSKQPAAPAEGLSADAAEFPSVQSVLDVSPTTMIDFPLYDSQSYAVVPFRDFPSQMEVATRMDAIFSQRGFQNRVSSECSELMVRALEDYIKDVVHSATMLKRTSFANTQASLRRTPRVSAANGDNDDDSKLAADSEDRLEYWASSVPAGAVSQYTSQTGETLQSAYNRYISYPPHRESAEEVLDPLILTPMDVVTTLQMFPRLAPRNRQRYMERLMSYHVG